MPLDLPATSGATIPVTRVLLTAARLAGVVPFTNSTGPMVEQYTLGGLDFLTSVLNELAAEGPLARTISFYDITLLGDSSTYKYSLPESVLSVHGDGAYIDPGEDTDRAAGETHVTQVLRERWHGLSDHATVGTPALMYVHRDELPLQAWFWPIPNAAGTVRVQVQTFSFDVKTGKDVDLLPHWYSYLHYELSSWFADATNQPEKAAEHRRTAMAKKMLAKALSNENVGSQAHLGHMSGWGSR